jgi:RNA polymerase sigma-70 factor (ECF subfamily)
LYSIAYRTALSKLRSRKPAMSNTEEVPAQFLAAHSDDGTEAQDRKRALEVALAELPEEDSTIVTLFYLHEQSVEEIVTITGLSASNVKVKLHRSRKRMQETLQKLLKEELWTIHTP